MAHLFIFSMATPPPVFKQVAKVHWPLVSCAIIIVKRLITLWSTLLWRPIILYDLCVIVCRWTIQSSGFWTIHNLFLYFILFIYLLFFFVCLFVLIRKSFIFCWVGYRRQSYCVGWDTDVSHIMLGGIPTSVILCWAGYRRQSYCAGWDTDVSYIILGGIRTSGWTKIRWTPMESVLEAENEKLWTSGVLWDYESDWILCCNYICLR